MVAKGFTPTYGVDYLEALSPVAHLNSIRFIFSLAVNQDWPMYLMDVTNTFPMVSEVVFMEYVA